MVKTGAKEHAVQIDCSEDVRAVEGKSIARSTVEDVRMPKTSHKKRKEKKTKRKKKRSTSVASRKKRSTSAVSKKGLSRKLSKSSRTSKKGGKSKKKRRSQAKTKSLSRNSGLAKHSKRKQKGSKSSGKNSLYRVPSTSGGTHAGDPEKFSINELNWSTFDVIVSLQVVGAGIFLLLAFVAGIVGISAFWSPMLMSLLLFLCAIPGFWCIIRNKIQDGILAFSITQLASGFCGLFWGTVTLLDFEQGDRNEDWRSITIMVIALWQFFTVIAVNSLPYRKVSLVDVVKRLKKIRTTKDANSSPYVESTIEEGPSSLLGMSQNNRIVINMDDAASRSRSNGSSLQNRLASYLKLTKERKEKDKMARMQRKEKDIEMAKVEKDSISTATRFPRVESMRNEDYADSSSPFSASPFTESQTQLTSPFKKP